MTLSHALTLASTDNTRAHAFQTEKLNGYDKGVVFHRITRATNLQASLT